MRKKYNTQELERRIEKIKKLILERNQIHEELSKLIDLNTDLESLTNQSQAIEHENSQKF